MAQAGKVYFKPNRASLSVRRGHSSIGQQRHHPRKRQIPQMTNSKEEIMCNTGLKFGALVLAGGAIAVLAYGASHAADSIPDFMQGGMGWASAGGMTQVDGSPPPVA